MLKYYEQKKSKRANAQSGKSFFNRIVFNQQYKENFKGWLTISIVIAAIMILVLALYPSVQEMYADMLASMSPEMINFINSMGGMPENIADYFAMEGGQTYMLVGAIYAGVLGINLIKKEIKDGSAEFLYSQPVSKGSIFRTKMLILIVNIFLVNLIAMGTSIVMMYIIEGAFTFSLLNFLIYAGVALVIHLQIGLISFAIAGIARKNASIGIAIGFAFFSYILAIISKIATDVEFLKYFTPFTYIMGKTEGTQTLTVIKDGVSAVDAPTLLIFSAITVVALLYSHMHFKKNDIL